MRARRFLAFLVVSTLPWLASCDAEPPAPKIVLGAEAPAPGKPQAPVSLVLEARDLGGGEHEVTLTVVPTASVAELEARVSGTDVIVAGPGRAVFG